MTLYSLIFYALAAVIVAATGIAVTRRNQVHAVLFLVVSFFGTAVLFYLLGAPVLAGLEVIIYAGGIMVLFLFIIMTMSMRESGGGASKLVRWGFPAALGTVSLGIGAILMHNDPVARFRLGAAMAPPAEFGRYLFQSYWFAVEVASFLLFVGLVGALYLGRHDDGAQTRSQKHEDNRG